MLRQNASIVVTRLVVPALNAKPEDLEPAQLLLAVARLEQSALEPSLPVLWRSLRTALASGNEDASLAFLSVLGELLDGVGTRVMILGPTGNEFSEVFVNCLDPRCWSTTRVGVAVLQMATLWVRKQMRHLSKGPAPVLGAIVQRFILLLQVRRWHHSIRLLWASVIEIQIPSILPQMGQALEQMWTLMIQDERAGGGDGGDWDDDDDEDDAQEMKVVALQESDAPLQRVRLWLLGPDVGPVSKRAFKWGDVCGAAVRAYGTVVCQWVHARVGGLLTRWNSSQQQPADPLLTAQVEAALSLFAQTADSLVQLGPGYLQLVELLIGAQERQGALSVYGALAGTIEFWESQQGAPPLLLRSLGLALRDAKHARPALDYALLACRLLRHLVAPHATALIPAGATDLRIIACGLLLNTHTGVPFPYRPTQQYPREHLRAAAAAAWLMSQLCEGSVLKAAQVQQLWVQLLDGGQLLAALASHTQQHADVAITVVHCLVHSVGPLSQSHVSLVTVLEALTREAFANVAVVAIDSSHLLQCIEELLRLRVQAQIRARLEALVSFVVPRIWQHAVDARPQCVAVAEQLLIVGEVCQTALPLLSCILEGVCSNELSLWCRAMDAFLHVRRTRPALSWPMDKVGSAMGAIISRLVDRNGTQLEKAENVLYSLSHLNWIALETLLGSTYCIGLKDTTADVFIEVLRKLIRQRRLLQGIGGD